MIFTIAVIVVALSFVITWHLCPFRIPVCLAVLPRDIERIMRFYLCLLLSVPFCASAQTINFDKDQPASVPAGWTVAMTHEGGPPRWETVGDSTAPSAPNVLAQTSTDDTNGRYPLAISPAAPFKDGRVSVMFKTVCGKRDQAAGIVWRYRDPDNYYIVRANALENNVVLYKLEGGKRTAIAPIGTPPETYGVEHPVPAAQWHRLEAAFEGQTFRVSFNGRLIMEVEDTTFTEAGRTGLWTKADSVTLFDDFASSRQ